MRYCSANYISTFYFEPNKCHEIKNTDENLAKFFRECLVWDYEEEGIIPAVIIWDNFEGSVVEYFVFCENKRIAYWKEDET